MKPAAFAVSRWGTDPWSRGSWSLIGCGGSPQDRITLGAPIAGRLRIAGEATHPTRAGMTHGAYEQGVAAADWALGLGHRRVGVVGAGMAGLAAAQRLTEQGAQAVVWEARERVGGRATGVEVGGAALDLGANWLQQYDENVLARLAERLGLTMVATDFTSPRVLGREPEAVDGLEDELRKRLRAASEGASVADVLDEWTNDPAPWSENAIRRFADAEIMMDAGVPLGRLSARHGFEAGVGEGDRWIVGGYRLLTEHLAEGLDLRLGQPVGQIRMDDVGVELAGERVDAVVVTAPVNVLAADVIKFVPDLPEAHRLALGRLRMGRVEKVFLRFPQRFWPQSESGYYRVHGPEDGSVSEWLDATALDGTPTLAGLFAGPWLERLWAGTDEEVALAAAAVFSRAASPKPVP